jgi:hypothetical protein
MEIAEGDVGAGVGLRNELLRFDVGENLLLLRCTVGTGQGYTRLLAHVRTAAGSCLRRGSRVAQ